ncbi:hypothetical protein Gpo141_00008360 [Globisporangium polare]
MAAPFARNALLATRARLAPAVAARAASTLSTSSAFGGNFAQSPAIMMMALDRAPAQTVVEPFVNHSLIFETSLDLPMLELPELNQIGGLECPTDNLNEPLQAIKRTYQPSVLRRKRKHGFRSRRLTISGRKMLTRRFVKGRWRMSM